MKQSRRKPANSSPELPAHTERVTLPIGDVIPNPRNDRVHPRAQIDLLKASVERWGQPRPILVRKANRMIVTGHGVHGAMTELGRTEIEVLLWDVDQKTADAFLIADNRFGELSHSDQERRRSLLEQFTEDDYPALGFLPEEVAELLADDDNTAPIQVHEIETGPVNDSFWVSIRGPLEQQAYALKRLRELMAELPDVEVDLGTVT